MTLNGHFSRPAETDPYGLDGHHGQDRGDRQDRQSLKARQDITHIFAGGVLKDLQNRYDCH